MKDEIQTKFYYNQKVIVVKGFNRGRSGTVKEFEVNKDETIKYMVEIENKETGKKQTETIAESFLKKFSFLPF